VSGFDFDALRDPLAPEPGERERSAVAARARQLRARSRRNRLALSSVSVVAVVALVFGIVASQRDNGPTITVAGPSGTTASSIANRFVPPTSVDNGIVTLPVTFPDGETTTLTYPESLHIAQLGFTGGIGVNDPVKGGCCGSEVLIKYTTIARVYGNAQPVATYPGASGDAVPLFQSSQAPGYVGDNADYLEFQFGPWLAQADATAMTGEQRATFARSLTGTTDGNGYLVLHAAAPLAVNDEFDGGFGPFVARDNEVELASHLYCGQPESDTSTHRRFVNGDGSHGVSWCAGALAVAASGTQSFVDAADRGLHVSDPASPAPPTATESTTTTTSTTTTVPTATSSPAASASFVSPDHGWALQQDGNVAETTDGGRTWHPVGSGAVGRGKIRFADAKHGYAFDDSRLLSTADGGRHWSSVSTPFRGFADVAISKGTVYVASYDTTDATVDVWTAPVGTTHWTKHPTSIPIGAGPIPSTQLVLPNDGPGLLLQVDRTVVGAADELGDGSWAPYAAPCANVNGPAYLAASSVNDIVASCSEHDYGGGPIQSSVWFSHDGGGQFKRATAPEFGQIASPNASTAIIVGSAGVQRTTDDGATWHGVFDFGGNATDLGFTTPTQGFIIFDNGTMLMTRDAGATWQEVKLP